TPGPLAHEFAVCFAGRFQRELDAAGARVHALGETRIRRPWTILRARRRLAALLVRQRFDAVVCHQCWPEALFASVAHGPTRVFWVHTPMSRNGGHWLERWALAARTDVVLAGSRFLAR